MPEAHSLQLVNIIYHPNFYMYSTFIIITSKHFSILLSLVTKHLLSKKNYTPPYFRSMQLLL